MWHHLYVHAIVENTRLLKSVTPMMQFSWGRHLSLSLSPLLSLWPSNFHSIIQVLCSKGSSSIKSRFAALESKILYFIEGERITLF